MSLEAAVARAVGRAVRGLKRVGGGDINDAYTAELEGGGRAFVKTRADAPAGEYAAEAAALDWLGEPGALGVPEVLGVLDGRTSRGCSRSSGSTRGRPGDEAELGRGLAPCTRPGADAFGGGVAAADRAARAARTTRCRRLARVLRRAAAAAAARAGARPRRAVGAGARAVERVCDRIADLAGPAEPPARLHGDLWSGNVLWSGGRPFLIDPVAYGGHREVDLAMLRLFGAPGPRFLAAYEEVAPLAAGHEDRVGAVAALPAARPRGAVRRRLRRLGRAGRAAIRWPWPWTWGSPDGWRW